MSEQNDSNASVNPASTGPNTMSIEELQQRIAELERANRGILEDKKSEVRKRQELEDKLSHVEHSLTSAATESDEQAVSPQVDQFLNQYVLPRINSVIQPLQKTNEYLARKDAYRDAIEWLAEQEDTKASKVKGSKLEQELSEIAREHNMGSMGLFDGTRAAYEIYKRRQSEKASQNQANETSRNAAIQQNSSEQQSLPRTEPRGRFWKQSEIDKLDPGTKAYEDAREDILLAMREGRIDRNK